MRVETILFKSYYLKGRREYVFIINIKRALLNLRIYQNNIISPNVIKTWQFLKSVLPCLKYVYARKEDFDWFVICPTH